MIQEKNFQYDAYIFDLDGTLNDPSIPIGYGIVAALEFAGVHNIDRAETSRWIGRPLTEIFTYYLENNGKKAPDETLYHEMVKAYRLGHDAHFTGEAKVYPGVIEILDALRKAGKKIGVATTKYQEAAEYCIRELGLTSRIDKINGTDWGNPVKPDPYVVNLAISRLEVTPEQVLFVGDTTGDIRAAHAAGCHVAALTFGFGKIEDLKALEPEYMFDSITELP